MTLEEEVTKMMDHAVNRSAPILQAVVSGQPLDATQTRDAFSIVIETLNGQREAILRIAREIDQS